MAEPNLDDDKASASKLLDAMLATSANTLGSVPAAIEAVSADSIVAETQYDLERKFVAQVLASAPEMIMHIVDFYTEPPQKGLTSGILAGIDAGLVIRLSRTEYANLLSSSRFPIGDVRALILNREFDLLGGLFFAVPNTVLTIQQGLKSVHPDLTQKSEGGQRVIRAIALAALEILIGNEYPDEQQRVRLERLLIAFGVIARLIPLQDDVHLRRADLMIGATNPYVTKSLEGVFRKGQNFPRTLFAMALVTDERKES